MIAILLRSILLLSLILPAQASRAGLPAQGDPNVATYAIDVRLLTETHRLEGSETITYRNTTSAAMTDLVFHLYLNAFKDTNTIFMRESGGMSRGNAASADENGWIEVSDLRLGDGAETTLVLEPLEDGTLARAVLPQAVQPGGSVTVKLSFTAQLPRVFARTGWALDAAGQPFFMVAQWFPKLGVLTERGWNAYPFHANSEFFADYGTFDVRVTTPAGYQIAAVGDAGVVVQTPSGAADMQTMAFHAERVIDFAFAASPNLKFASRTVGPTEIIYAYLPEHAWTVTRALDSSELALTHFSDWFTPYPYPRLTVLDVPDTGAGAGGMEYPTLVTAGTLGVPPSASQAASSVLVERSMELVIIHEIGHQWWMGLVGFNEAEEPWLDEGFTDYSTVRLMNEVYGEQSSVVRAGNLQAGYLDLRRGSYLALPNTPMLGQAWDFNSQQYEVAAYAKPALSLLTLERTLGADTMLAVMSTFAQRYQYAHPTTDDFQRTAEEISQADLGWFFGGAGRGGGLVRSGDWVNYRAGAITANSDGGSPDGSTISVLRQGELTLPVEILVTYQDGTRELLVWDGFSGAEVVTGQVDPPPAGTANSAPVLTVERRFSLDKPVRQFEIDPERKLVVELVWSDNGLSRALDFPAWLKVVTRLVYRLQDWLLALGGI